MAENVTISDELIEWREQIGVRLLLATRCTHDGDDFGPGAVCVICFDNVQRVGEITQDVAANAWEQGRRAERRDWEFTADLATPDEERQPLSNPYRLPDTSPAPATERPHTDG